MKRTYEEKPDRHDAMGRGLWKTGVISLVVVAVLLALLLYFSKGDPVRYEATNATKNVTLPDGSRVTLNENSSLLVNANFSSESRTVTLNGEAFFEIGPGERHPLIIQAGHARIVATQGSFSINAYDSISEVEVIVEAGIVRLQPSGGKVTDILPGERGVIAKADKQMSISVNEDVNYLSWKTKHLVFVDRDLLSVISALEQVYHAKITVNTDAASSCMVTITLDEPSLESVMRKLEGVLKLTYSIRGDIVEITEVDC